MDTIKTAIVSYGYATRTFHLPLMFSQSAYCLESFVERSGPKASYQHPGTSSHPTLEELLTREKPDLVVIASPNATHGDYIRQCLEAGCHVLVEKPLCRTAEEARDLAHLAHEKGRILSVFHNRRFDGDYLTLESVVRQGHLGRLVQFESRMDRWNPGIRAKAWKESGEEGAQIIDDLGSHLIDQVLRLWGVPARVSARFAREREGSLSEDAMQVNLEYPGFSAEVKAGLMWRESPFRFALTGTGGSLLIHGADGQEGRLKAGMIAGADLGRPSPDQQAILHDDQGRHPIPLAYGQYPRFYQELARAIIHGDPAPSPAEDLIDLHRVIDACRQSAATGGWIFLDAVQGTP